MSYSIIKAGTPEELARELGGYVNSKTNLNRGRDPGRTTPATALDKSLYKHPVDGLTLIFSTPAGTVTFSDNLSLFDIVEEINTALGSDVAHLQKRGPNGETVLFLWDDTTPVVLDEAGTANPYFGFPTTAAHPGLTQVAVDPTKIVDVLVDNFSRQYVALITT